MSGSLAPAGGSNYIEGGMVGRGSVNYSYTPKVESPLVDMCDLYVWNDDIEDYQLVSMATPNVCIYDRPQSRVGVKGLPHFVVIRPEDNLYDYFWGDSFTARLAWLQDWRTKRTFQIDKLQEKQVDPPAAATGFGGLDRGKIRHDALGRWPHFLAHARCQVRAVSAQRARGPLRLAGADGRDVR